MARVVPFYPDHWLAGTADLSRDEKACYIDWIASYSSRDGLFPDDIRLFASIWGCDIRVAKRIRRQLFAKGKLYKEGDFVHQVLIKSVVHKVLAKSAQATDAAMKRWKNYRENNGTLFADAYASAHADVPKSAYADPSPLEDKKERSSFLTAARENGTQKSQQENKADQQSPRSLATALPSGALAHSAQTEVPPEIEELRRKRPDELSLADINRLQGWVCR
jgi:hypothetical protein